MFFKDKRKKITAFSKLALLVTISLAWLISCCRTDTLQTKAIPVAPSYIQSYFSPNGGCTEAIITEIKQAKECILVQAYSFTSEPIASALIDAYKRGGKVEIIVDKSQENGKGSKADVVSKAGIPTFIDSKHAIAHNKIILIDHKVIITGSFNFTANAEERNAENLLVIKGNPELLSKYELNYTNCKEHSVTIN
ncbi:MAG: phospholipase D family protein [Candidatus Omnitrophica bacterium]|nr:phospholipase D family protein [Candidatus Omnitrophota bacterium]